MTINDTTESLILNIILMFITIFSIWKDIYKKQSPGYFLRRLTWGGYIFITSTILFVWVNYRRDSQNANKLEQSELRKANVDRLLTNSYHNLSATSDSLRIAQNKFSTLQVSMKDTILSHVEASNIRAIKATNEGLEKYNLQFIDSLKTIKPINKAQIAFLAGGENTPEVYVTKDGEQNELIIKMKSVNNVSYNIELNYCILLVEPTVRNHANYKPLYCSNFVTKFTHSILIPGTFTNINLDIEKDWLKLHCIILFYGDFSLDPLDKNKIPFQEGVDYDFSKSKFIGTIPLLTKLSILNVLKNAGIELSKIK